MRSHNVTLVAITRKDLVELARVLKPGGLDDEGRIKIKCEDLFYSEQIPEKCSSLLTAVAIKHGSSEGRSVAVDIITGIEESDLLTSFLQLLRTYDENPMVKSRSLRPLGICYPSVAKDRMLELVLHDSSPMTRITAFEVLAQSNWETANNAYQKLKRDGGVSEDILSSFEIILERPHDIRTEANMVGGDLVTHEFFTLVCNAMYHDNPEMRLKALKEAIKAEPSIAAHLLTAAAYDNDDQVADYALEELETADSDLAYAVKQAKESST